ncbi:MAG: flagellar protein FlgN [Pseudohongiellaceae bacterium]|nr:flagellar protein FlgN [Pseudohongiellaceae bacterium]
MSATALHHLLQQDLDNTTDLIALLREERSLLAKRDIENLNGTLMRKAELLAKIESNDAQRKNILATEGYAVSNEGMKQFCIDNAADETIFDKLQANIRQCSELTDINGAIVHRSRMNTRQVLDILQGKVAGSSTYTSQGGTNKASESTAIAKA